MEVKIDDKKAKRLYPEAPEWLKKELEEQLGKDFFLPKDYKEIISYEIACEKRPVDDEDKIYETDPTYIVSLKELNHITKVVNGDWEVDIFNPNQKRWEPIFKTSGAGFGFAYSDSIYGASYTLVGSRLSYASKEICDFMGQQYLKKFETFINRKKQKYVNKRK